jgi:hypothetical protein
MNASTEPKELLVPVNDRLTRRSDAWIIRITDDHDPKQWARSVTRERRPIDATGTPDAVHARSEEEHDEDE